MYGNDVKQPRLKKQAGILPRPVISSGCHSFMTRMPHHFCRALVRHGNRGPRRTVSPPSALATFHPHRKTPDMSNKKIAKDLPTDQGASIVSRRGFLKFAGASSLATAAGTLASAARAANSAPDGTPEQVHLT